MAHRIGGRKLSRKQGPRISLFKNLTVSVIRYERVKTTEAKAKEISGRVEKMITLAKRGDLSARRAVVAQFPNERFGLRKMTADLDLFGLKKHHEAGDEIALGNAPMAVMGGLGVASGDGNRDNAARKFGLLENVEDGLAHAGGVQDKSGTLEFRTPDEMVDMVRYIRVGGPKRDALQVSQGMAGLRVPGIRNEAAVQDDAGAFQYGDGRGVMHLAKIEAHEVLGLMYIGRLGGNSFS